MRKVLLSMILLAVFAATTHSGTYVSGSASCPVSGNAQVSTTAYSVYSLTVTANIANTGYIHLGSPSVTTSTGGVLVAGGSFSDSRSSAALNPASLYFACTASADGLTWIGSR